MNSAIEDNERFDHEMRQLHAAAVNQLSPQTLARLRASRQGLSAARRGWSWRWLAATACSAALAVPLGLQLLPPSGTAPSAPAAAPVATAAAVDDYSSSGVSALEENPDLYLWLASPEAQRMAME